MTRIDYDRIKAVSYARKWAFSRNPSYYNFDKLGGDCTNFASQCLFAGVGVMNYTPDEGWFYRSLYSRAAAWTGVEYFYNFITENADVGPFGRVVTRDELELGDVIQLGREAEGYYHTLIVVGFDSDDVLVAAQTDNAYARPLSTYTYDFSRFIKVLGIRFETPDSYSCFARLMEG